MEEYRAIYKCRMCGEEYESQECVFKEIGTTYRLSTMFAKTALLDFRILSG